MKLATFYARNYKSSISLDLLLYDLSGKQDSIDKSYEIRNYRFRPGTCREERTIETVSFRNKVVCTFFYLSNFN